MNIPEISPQDAHDRLQADPSVRLIDVRQPEEFATYRAPEATLIPLGEIEARHTGELDKDGHYLIVCERGGRSAQACGFLAAQGYANVLNVAGGMSSWAASGLPLADTSGADSSDDGASDEGASGGEPKGGFLKRLFGGS